MPRYYHLVKVGRTARKAGILSLIFTISELALLIALGHSIMSMTDIVVLATLQILPGMIVISLSESAGDGNPKSFFVIFAVAVLAPLRSVVAMFLSGKSLAGPVGFFCDIYTSVPLIWLAWTCNESLADVRQLIRRRREDRFGEHRGFAPILSNAAVARPEATIVQPIAGPQPVVPLAYASKPAERPRRKAMSHHMSLATQMARTMAIISMSAAVLLVAMHFAVGFDRGYKQFDATLQTVVLYYVLPAALLVLLSWRMDRQEFWAYLVCTILSFGLLARMAVSVAMAMGLRLQFADFSYVVDNLSRWPYIFLAVRCVNAMPDVLDARRQRKREQAIDRKNAWSEAPATLASVVPPPPSGTRSVTRTPVRGTQADT